MPIKTFNTRIQLKSDTKTNWDNSTFNLLNGEFAFDITKQNFKMGDGSHKFSQLNYIIGSAIIVDYTALGSGVTPIPITNTMSLNTALANLQGQVSGMQPAFQDGSHDIITITNGGQGDVFAKKWDFFDGTQTNGTLGTALSSSESLWFSKEVTSTNPILTKDDISGVIGAMVYKGTVNSNSDLPTVSTPGVQAGWTYVVGTSGTYAGQSCEVGDMIIVQEVGSSSITFDIINGENQVTNYNQFITTTASTNSSDTTRIATIDGTDIKIGVNVPAGNATIATLSGNTVMLKAGVTQGTQNDPSSGQIFNSSGSGFDDIVLADVAYTGSYNDLDDTPTIPTVGALSYTSSTASIPVNPESFTGNITLHNVAKTGNITDLYQSPLVSGNTVDLVIFDCGSASVNNNS